MRQERGLQSLESVLSPWKGSLGFRCFGLMTRQLVPVLEPHFPAACLGVAPSLSEPHLLLQEVIITLPTRSSCGGGISEPRQNNSHTVSGTGGQVIRPCYLPPGRLPPFPAEAEAAALAIAASARGYRAAAVPDLKRV